MIYNIIPYVGAGPLRLGMTQADAYAILGKPESALPDANAPLELTTIYWENSGLQLIFDIKKDYLLSISFYSNIENIELDGLILDWNKTEEMYDYLVKNDTSAKEAYGITVFFGKGISVDSFEKDQTSNKSLTVFARGQFDPSAPYFKPVSIK